MYHIPIPSVTKLKNWKEVKIEPREEKLVSLESLALNHLILSPQYSLQGIEGSNTECFVRETVRNLLLLAAKKLPKGFRLVIWDTWRPVTVQKYLFQQCLEHFRNEKPHLQEDELLIWTQKYISLPSVSLSHPFPHYTGGSVDLSIADDKGNLLPMGTEFDEMIAGANTRFYEEKFENGTILEHELEYLYHRRLLYHVMTSVGFSNYHEEWWHYDYGNQLWGSVLHTNAFYGPIEKE